jgi:hypothetical protein
MKIIFNWIDKHNLLFSIIIITLLFLTGIIKNLSSLHSDSLFALFFSNDILDSDISLNGWMIPSHPYIFPDILLFTLLNYLFGSILLIYLIYYLAIYASFLGIIYLINKRKKNETYNWVLFLLWEGIRLHVWYGGYEFIPGHHFSMVLYSLFLFLASTYKLSIKNFLFIITISITGGGSDTLYLTFAFLPSMLYFILSSKGNEKITRPLILFIGTVMGVFLKYTLASVFGLSFVKHTWSIDLITPSYFLTTSLKMFNELFNMFFLKPPFEGFVLLVFFGFYIIILTNKIKNNEFRVSFIDYIILSIVFSFSALFLGCRYEDTSSIRYALPLIFMPPIYVFFYIIKRKLFPYILVFLYILAIGVFIYDSSYFKMPTSDLAPYPDIKKTIEFLDEKDMVFGSAEYWFAKKIMAFDKGLLIMQINNEAEYNSIISNKNRFAGFNPEDSQFIILNNLDENKMRSKFANLKNIIEFGDIRILY